MKWLRNMLGLKPKKPSYFELELELQQLKSEIRGCRDWMSAEFPEIAAVTSYLTNMSGSNSYDRLREELRSLKRQGLLTPDSAALHKMFARHEHYLAENEAYKRGGLAEMNKLNGYDKL